MTDLRFEQGESACSLLLNWVATALNSKLIDLDSQRTADAGLFPTAARSSSTCRSRCRNVGWQQKPVVSPTNV
jgi:hypothetical protein